MSLKNNRNILIGSIIESLDKRKTLGKTFDKNSYLYLELIVSNIEYAINKYNVSKDNKYFEKIKSLNNKFNDIKKKFPEICNYKDRIIIQE